MAKSETYTNFIIDELRKGNVRYKDLLNLFEPKWTLSESTFKRHWNTANERYNNELQAIEKQKTALYSESQLQAAKDEIADDLETKKNATKTLRLAMQVLDAESEKEEKAGIDLKVVAAVNKIVIDTRKTLGYEKISIESNTKHEGLMPTMDYSKLTKEERATYVALKDKANGLEF